MTILWQDFRYSVRMLIKRPGFTLVAVMTLALGIGANTLVFSIVNRLLLNPLPYKDGQRLVFLWQTNPQIGPFNRSPSDEAIEFWQREAKSFEGIEAFTSREQTLTGGAEPEAIGVGLVSPGLFPFLGVAPQLGRAFSPEDISQRVVMLSDGLWRRRFGANPKIIGQQIALKDENYTIVGVMPSGFLLLFFGQEQAWLPLPPAPKGPGALPRGLNAIARLKRGVTVEAANAELTALAAPLEKQSPRTKGWVGKVMPPEEMLVKNVRDALPVLFGAVGLVLLIACANVAGLVLARNAARAQEIAIRLALGAGRWQLMRQLLAENLLLTVAGGLLGVLLALWGLDLVIALKPSNVPQLAEVRLNRVTLVFSLAVSLLTGLLFGLLPAWRATRADLGLTLKQGSRSAAARHTFSRKVLVVGEVALSLVLLAGAGLMMRSFLRLQRVDLGFNPESVLTLRLELPQNRYPNDADSINFGEQLRSRARQLQGVQAAEVASGMPLKLGLYMGQFEIERRAPTAAQQQPTHFGGGGVGPDYFRLWGTQMTKGRAFTAEDTAQAPRVVIINEAMAQRYWPGEDPLGQRFRFSARDEWATIVGVAGNAKGGGVEPDTLQLQIFFPFAQQPSPAMFLLVRTQLDPARLIPALKSQVWSLDAKLPIKDIQTAEAAIGEALSRQRFTLVLMTFFAALAVILAAVGVYGLMAYLVTQRTHEIGIRMALGAQRRDVLRLVVGQGMTLSLIGVSIGLALAFGVTRFLASLLYEVGTTDAPTFVLISLLLLGVALLACYLPARRAMKVDPMVALRYE